MPPYDGPDPICIGRDDFDGHPAIESQLVDQLEVERILNGDGQGSAAERDGSDVFAARQIRRQGIDGPAQ